jgi:hypothetical protein
MATRRRTTTREDSGDPFVVREMRGRWFVLAGSAAVSDWPEESQAIEAARQLNRENREGIERFTAEDLLVPLHPTDCRECGGCGWWQDGRSRWPCACNPNRLPAGECFRLRDERRAAHAKKAQ